MFPKYQRARRSSRRYITNEQESQQPIPGLAQRPVTPEERTSLGPLCKPPPNNGSSPLSPVDKDLETAVIHANGDGDSSVASPDTSLSPMPAAPRTTEQESESQPQRPESPEKSHPEAEKGPAGQQILTSEERVLSYSPKSGLKCSPLVPESANEDPETAVIKAFFDGSGRGRLLSVNRYTQPMFPLHSQLYSTKHPELEGRGSISIERLDLRDYAELFTLLLGS
jgi:hypothetical protein